MIMKMSTRPSDLFNFGSSCPVTTTDYAIIGNTVAALLYVLKLTKDGVNTNIHVISGVYSNLDNFGVESMDYIPQNVRTILHSLISDRIHYFGPQQCPTTAYSHYLIERCVGYMLGCGTLGDVISSPKLPNFGPWFHKNMNNSKQIQRFVDLFTTVGPLNTIESTLADRLNLIWGVPMASSVTVSQPSISCKHYLLKKVKHNMYVREIFKDIHDAIALKPNVFFHNAPNTLFFEKNLTTPGNYNINTHDWILNNVNLIFKTNPYSFLSVANRGGLCTAPVDIPSSYRAVIPITYTGAVSVGTVGSNNTGLTFSPLQIQKVTPTATTGCGCPSPTPANCDSTCPVDTNHVIAENTFSLPDFGNNNNPTKLTWVGHQYLVEEDYFPTNQTGWFAGAGYNLLIVECICYDNARSCTFSNDNQEIQITYNSKAQEEKFLLQFGKIVCDVIFAYTGTIILPSSILAKQVLDVSNGAAMDSNMVENITLRETSLSIALEMIAGIYGHEYYSIYGNV